jgi:hypothetical protein
LSSKAKRQSSRRQISERARDASALFARRGVLRSEASSHQAEGSIISLPGKGEGEIKERRKTNMTCVKVDLSNVDWRLLRKQKLSLLKAVKIRAKTGASESAEHLRGLVHLLDHIQDQAAEALGEEVVFGKKRA